MKYCLVLFYLIYWSGLIGQMPSYEQYSLKDGLPQSQVYALEQDSSGLLWVGTFGGGLASFDGIKFETYGAPEGLGSLQIQCLQTLPNGLLAVGTTNGLFIGREQFQAVGRQDGSPTSINDLALFNGTLYAAGPGGIWAWTNGALKKMPSPATEEVFSLTANDSKIYAGGTEGLFVLKQDTWQSTNYQARSKLINAIAVLGDSAVAIGYYGSGLDIWDQRGQQQVGAFRNKIIEALLAEEGKLIVSTLKSGLFFYDLAFDQVQTHDEAHGLFSNDIKSLLRDDWGQLWLGSSGAGLAKWLDNPFEHYDKATGLPDNEAYSVACLSDGRLAIGNGNSGLVYLSPEEGVAISPDPILTAGKVKALFEDSNERLWAGTEGNGVYVFDNDSSFHLSRDNGLTSNWIKHIAEGEDGSIYLSSYGGGIMVLKQRSLDPFDFSVERFTSRNGFPQGRYTFSVPLRENSLLAGSLEHGLVLAKRTESYKSYDEADGEKIGATTCYAQSDTCFFIGSSKKGLLRVLAEGDSLQLTSLAQEWQPVGANIYSLQLRGNELWAGTEKGVTLIELNADWQPISKRHFGFQEGFKGIETCTRANCLAPSDKIWMGTIDGLTAIGQINGLEETTAPPVIGFQEMRLLYNELDLDTILDRTTPLSFNFRENDLSFKAEARHLKHPQSISYHWKLDGQDSEWNEALGSTNISYSNLAPGAYTFEIYARVKGEASKAIGIPFLISAPWWKAWWVWPLAILIVVLILALILWSIWRRIRRKAKIKEERLAMERELLDLERKAIQLQMNPHFLFNALNSIQGMVASKDVLTARRLLSQFARLMRKVLDNSRKEHIGLDEEIEAIQHYLELEQAMNSTEAGALFGFEIVWEVEPQLYAMPPMIVQPFVENAIIHGVLPKANLESHAKGFISVRIEETDGHLIQIIIEDNGVGRNAKKSASRHKSVALEVTQKRLAQLDGKGKTLQIIDLKNGDQPAGTQVILTLPKIENEDF